MEFLPVVKLKNKSENNKGIVFYGGYAKISGVIRGLVVLSWQ